MLNFFEKLLWSSRYIILIPVISSLLSAIVLILLSAIKTFKIIAGFIEMIFTPQVFQQYYKLAVPDIISTVDLFLIALVLIIFGMGIYELFISKIYAAEGSKNASSILIIETLDELKDKLAHLIIMVLIVTYFNYAFSLTYNDIYSLLLLGAGILLISVSVLILHYGKSKASKSKTEEKT